MQRFIGMIGNGGGGAGGIKTIRENEIEITILGGSYQEDGVSIPTYGIWAYYKEEQILDLVFPKTHPLGNRVKAVLENENKTLWDHLMKYVDIADILQRVYDRAFAAGRRDKLMEIRKALDV